MSLLKADREYLLPKILALSWDEPKSSWELTKELEASGIDFSRTSVKGEGIIFACLRELVDAGELTYHPFEDHIYRRVIKSTQTKSVKKWWQLWK